MTAKAGRQVSLYIVDGTEMTKIAAVKTKGLTISNEPVDITSDDDAGWKSALADITGTRSVSFSVEGILKTNQVGLLAEGQVQVPLLMDFPTVRSYAGDFNCTSYELGAETAAGVTFSASFESSGPVTFAAALA